MDKIAIVVQRYSEDINGGAELHARLLAERLGKIYNVDVLTSCANDYLSWDNYYQDGCEIINGINVIRFPSEKKDIKAFKKLSRYFYRNYHFGRTRFNIVNFPYLLFKKWQYKLRKNHDQLFEEWIIRQGPLSKQLIEYLADNKSKYSAFIFFTYLYYPTYIGLQKVAEKSILIPTAHDEPPFYFSGFKKLFSSAQFIMYNTASEKELVESTYKETMNIKSDIAGVGFESPEFDKKIKPPIDSDYFVYIGRIDVNKGCKNLIEYFEYFNKTENKDIKLVLIGKDYMNSPKSSDKIIYAGYIDEQEKLSYLNYAKGLIIPSQYESLSMVTLEAMTIGKPVIANGKCDVLKKHIEVSKAGVVFYDRNDFCESLSRILSLSEDEQKIVANNGRSYVEKNYQWSGIIGKFKNAIDYVFINSVSTK